MSRHIKSEDFRYRFMIAAQGYDFRPTCAGQPSWQEFVQKLDFCNEKNSLRINWKSAHPVSLTFPLDDSRCNMHVDDHMILRVAQAAGYEQGRIISPLNHGRLSRELVFHDMWADSENVEAINVRLTNEACTAPEMRYIISSLGDISGKRLLDVGCGLGEASVYFALQGARVTSSDLSQSMLHATSRLAQNNGVCVTPHLATAENINLSADALFDIIYAGNLLHHVNIDRTLPTLKSHLAPDGVLVTWDPLAYNPIINVYRAIATEVRTSDEHPLKWGDLQLFKKHFGTVDTEYFWFSTLIIFIIMALIQRRNPNKERFWKVILREEQRWRWLYLPLEKIDNLLLSLIPPLRLLCWNVVVICRI